MFAHLDKLMSIRLKNSLIVGCVFCITLCSTKNWSFSCIFGVSSNVLFFTLAIYLLALSLLYLTQVAALSSNSLDLSILALFSIKSRKCREMTRAFSIEKGVQSVTKKGVALKKEEDANCLEFLKKPKSVWFF